MTIVDWRHLGTTNKVQSLKFSILAKIYSSMTHYCCLLPLTVYKMLANVPCEE
jgi:hypothetical protein